MKKLPIATLTFKKKQTMKDKTQNKKVKSKTQEQNVYNSSIVEFTKHYYIPAALVFGIIYFIALNPTITGLVSGIENQITEDLDLTFTEYSAYSFNLQANPTSIKLSGTVEGSTKIYLLNGFKKYLIYETTENSDNILTGFAITIPEEITNENNESINSSVETVNETISIIENTNNNTTEEVINESVETNNETQNEITQETNNIIEFSNSCIETCLITNFSSTIELAIEVNGTLTLTSLTYTIEETENIETTNTTSETTQQTINETTQQTINETNISIGTNQSINETNISIGTNQTINETALIVTSALNSRDVDITIKEFFTYHITKLTYEDGITKIKFDILGEINETKEEVVKFKEKNNLKSAELKDFAKEQAKEKHEIAMIGNNIDKIYDLITEVDISLKTNIEASLE